MAIVLSRSTARPNRDGTVAAALICTLGGQRPPLRTTDLEMTSPPRIRRGVPSDSDSRPDRGATALCVRDARIARPRGHPLEPRLGSPCVEGQTPPGCQSGPGEESDRYRQGCCPALIRPAQTRKIQVATLRFSIGGNLRRAGPAPRTAPLGLKAARMRSALPTVRAGSSNHPAQQKRPGRSRALRCDG